MRVPLKAALLGATVLLPARADAQALPAGPAPGFPNSTSVSPGTVLDRLFDSYGRLLTGDPAVLTQNYQTVATMTQARTADQTLAAVRDDRTAQPYSVLNGLGPLTGLYLTGAGASFGGTTPTRLTPTTYAAPTLSEYAADIGLGTGASAGTTTFGNGTATPLAAAVSFINNVVRANGSTEPAKRIFERYQGATPAVDLLDPRYGNYNAITNRTALRASDTASLVVPAYLSSFPVPVVYGTTAAWVRGFTVTRAMIDANGGRPLTAPNVGSFDAPGTFTPATFGVGDYVPGVGTAPRSYRVSTSVSVPTLLQPIINGTNPYADGAFPSGHTNSGTLQALGVGFLVPQQFQELLARAADLGNDRILAGMHSPLDVMGGRMEATAIAATNIYAALYDASGNRLDWTNPANAAAYAVYEAYQQTQSYLAASCGAASVGACVAAASSAADPFGDAAQNRANYRARMTYGFQPTGPQAMMTAAEVPVQAQVLLLTRFPYLTDAQRTDVLASTGLPSGYPLLDGNTYGGWGRINLYAANDGYGAFASTVSVTMDASQGGYGTSDSWNNDISGPGGLIKNGSGALRLSGNDTYAGPTLVNGGTLTVDGSLVSTVTVAGGRLDGSGTVGGLAVLPGGTVAPGHSIGTLTVAGSAAFAAGSAYQVEADAAGRSDRLAVAGTVTLAGGTVQVLAQAGTYGPRTRYAILDAAGGVSGRFSGATSNFAFLTPTLRYEPTAVDLTLTRNDVAFSAIATTRNAAAVADAIQAGGPGAGAYAATVGLTTPEAQGAFRALAGDVHASAVSGSYQTAFFVREAILDRLRWGVTPGSADGPSFGDLPARYSADLPESRPPVASVPMRILDPTVVGVWGQGFGAFGGAGGGNAFGLDRTLAGFAAGLDLRLPSGFRLGLVGGYAESALDTAGRRESAGVTGGFGGVYGGYELGPVSVRLGAVYADESLRTRRTVVVPGVSDTPSGRYGGSTVQGFGEIGYRFLVGAPAPAVPVDAELGVPVRSAPTYVEPFVGGAYVGIHRDRFAETGGVAALTGSARDYDLGALTAGLRGQAAFDLGLGLPLSAHALLGYRRAYGDVVPKALLAFGAGPSFLSAGVPIDRDAVVAEVGLDLRLASGVTFGAAYTGQTGARAQDHAVKGNLTCWF
ncbi:autotransporter domain-containing protein [Methylobacterium sp. J-092]|uniref:autotransporter outer membrane beta-barrel domain-containing protein n=1 Tax=Methylobacterium sp. J-092 TaxID=2836667 RepID=UPI001FBB4EF4|nr:autotransporter domain-containing protein [Methylobacterium sp. J-092]MCJ2009140.1 autotransporter domain-containing protein [Methylobacterium sp. J-092]